METLLLVETEDAWEVRESILRLPGLRSWEDDGGLPSGGSLLSETLLEFEGEGEREGDRSRETSWDFDFVSLSRSRRRKPAKRPSLRESASEWASSLLGLEEEEEFAAGWSPPGTAR